MANFTKVAIKEAFLKLILERPYNEITVKDIVNECGINRNSFYYHYQDMVDLIEDIAKENCDAIIEKYPTPSSFEDCLNAAMDFACDNRKALYHIYKSVDRSIFERYLWKLIDYGVTRYLETAFPKEEINDQDKNILLIHFCCQCFGQIIYWMENGMKDDQRQDIPRLCEIYHGLSEEFLKRIKN